MFKFKIKNKKSSKMSDKDFRKLADYEEQMQKAIDRGDAEGQRELYESYHKKR